MVKIYGCPDTHIMLNQKLYSIAINTATILILFTSYILGHTNERLGKHINEMVRFRCLWSAPVKVVEMAYNAMVVADVPIPFILLIDVFYASSGFLFILEMIGKTLILNDWAALLGQ
ncbi:hypothetical protein HK102_009868, partial [Quaeritorhiza haematococci]